ncbi:WD40 repeat domain-containing protein [Candidatus Bipolaricaulota sp. J31]
MYWLSVIAVALAGTGGEFPLPAGAAAGIDTGWVADIAFSPDGRYLVLAVGNGLEVRDGDDLDLVRVIPLPEGERAYALATVSPGEIVVGCGDGTVLLVDVGSGAVSGRAVVHGGRVWALAAGPDMERVASVGEDGTLSVLELPGLRVTSTVMAHTEGALSVAFSPDGGLIATGGKGGDISLWDAATLAPAGELRGHGGAVWDLAFSTDGRFLLSTGADGIAIVWDVNTWEPLTTLAPGARKVFAGAFSPDGALLALAPSGYDVFLWDLEEETLLGELRGHTTLLWTLEFGPGGERLATVSADGRVILWDVRWLLSLRPRISKVHYTRRMKRMQQIGVSFIDPNGDISMAEIKLLEGDRATVHISPAERMQIHHYRNRNTGFFTLARL